MSAGNQESELKQTKLSFDYDDDYFDYDWDYPEDKAEQPSPEEADESEAFENDSAPVVDESRTGMPEMAPPLLVVCFVAAIFISSALSYQYGYLHLINEAQVAQAQPDQPEDPTQPKPDIEVIVEMPEQEMTLPQAPMIPEMRDFYEQNEDFIGWLKIDDMNVDYPVMQSMYDEEFYLERDFNKNHNINGCLIMDTDSVVGTGTAANDYRDGSKPCTNLIIHGHNMRNGDMFGHLDRYRDQKYCDEHRIIRFTSLYEEREYEVMAVFLSQVFLKTQTDVFKYYKFFQANTQEEFDDFYDHVKDMSLYDTGVTAELGDEFITLSVCAYHVENGRLVVVGKRIK